MGDINTLGRDEYHQHIRDIASTDDMHGEAEPYSEEPESRDLELPEKAAAAHAAPLTPIPASPLPMPAMSQDVAGLLLPPPALSPEGAAPSELASSPQSPATLPRSPNLGGQTSGSSRASSPVPDTPPPSSGFWKRLAKGGGKGTGKASKREKMADAVSVLLERTTSRSSVPKRLK